MNWFFFIVICYIVVVIYKLLSQIELVKTIIEVVLVYYLMRREGFETWKIIFA
jgi:hypothetical protein